MSDCSFNYGGEEETRLWLDTRYMNAGRELPNCPFCGGEQGISVLRILHAIRV